MTVDPAASYPDDWETVPPVPAVMVRKYCVANVTLAEALGDPQATEIVCAAPVLTYCVPAVPFCEPGPLSVCEVPGSQFNTTGVATV